MNEVRELLQIVNPLGLHARPAAALVQAVIGFEADVRIALNGNEVNAKSIMGLLTLAAAQGSEIEVICRGSDAFDALAAVRELVASGFGEH
jgi:phosphocarrier protein HPr